MNNSTKVAIAVIGGYALGRRKKAKMALLLGSWLVGKRLNLNLRQLGRDALEQLANNPQVAKLGGSVRDELWHAGRDAALTTVTGRMEKLADHLHERTAALSGQDDTGNEEKAEGRREEEDTAGSGVRRGEPRRQPAESRTRGRDEEESESGNAEGDDLGDEDLRSVESEPARPHPRRRSRTDGDEPRRSRRRSASTSQERSRQSDRPTRSTRDRTSSSDTGNRS